MLYILSLCTILPEPLRSTAPHQLCHVRHVRFGLLMTSLMLPHCLLIPRACCDPIAMCCAACDATAADALPCDAQTRCELRIQLRTCGTLCANCTSTPLHSSHFPYALPQHHLPLQDPSLDPMRVLQRSFLFSLAIGSDETCSTHGSLFQCGHPSSRHQYLEHHACG